MLEQNTEQLFNSNFVYGSFGLFTFIILCVCINFKIVFTVNFQCLAKQPVFDSCPQTDMTYSSVIQTKICLHLMLVVCPSTPQIGTHIRAKRKREELSNVLAAMRKAAAKKD